MAQAALLNQSVEHIPHNYSTPAGLQRSEFRAMGTIISLLLPEERALEGEQIVRSLFQEWEQTLSRFLPESELSRLNARTGAPVSVSELLYNVLETALEAARGTQGIYDPTLLKQLLRVGYDRTFEDLPPVQFSPQVVGEAGGHWREIIIDPWQRQVTLPFGVQLDFGGIAKGMAVDAALKKLRQREISPALVNAGGDLGVLDVPALIGVWPIAVPGLQQFWTIPLRSGTMATSGIARRSWQQGNTSRHHLLDPRSGLPAQGDLWSVTVVADRCEQAEVAAKVAFILGSARGAAFLHTHQIAGLLVRKDGTWQAVEPWPIELMEEK